MTLPLTELQASTTTVTAAETLMGSVIKVSSEDVITIWLDYTNGDETSVSVVPKFSHTASGDEFQFGSWSAAAGAKTFTSNSFSMTATGLYYIVLDVSGTNYVSVYMDATGGSPTGTLGATITVDRD